MRTIFTPIIAIIALSLSGCATLDGKRPSAAEFSRPALADLNYGAIDTSIAKTSRATLSNGIVVHMLADRELPLLNVAVMIKAGSIWEPSDKAGLASLTGATMRAGGTKSRPPEKLDETLEFLAASVETGIGAESGTVSLSVLSKDTGLGLEILADVLRNPGFDQGRFELAKRRMIDGIHRQNDNPTGIGMRELVKLVYEDSVYGRVAELETVESISRDDVIAFHGKYFTPASVMIGATGDFDEKELIAKLEKLFGDWRGETPDYPEVKPVAANFEGGVWIAEKSLPQSVIRMGHLVGLRTDPDYHAMRVMDDILGGGGFTSRLMKSVRVDRGLAYSVWSYGLAGRWELGRFMAGAETKASSTAEVVGIMLDEFARIRTEPVSNKELYEAKKSIVNSFIFLFDRPSKVLNQRMIVDYYDLSDDYLESYRDKVMAVSADDVMKVANRRLRPDGLKIIVVGDPEKIESDLGQFGPVKKIELRDYSNTGR